MCYHEIGQYDVERFREATSEDADDRGFGTDVADEDPDLEEPTVAPADD